MILIILSKIAELLRIKQFLHERPPFGMQNERSTFNLEYPTSNPVGVFILCWTLEVRCSTFSPFDA